jgi:Cell wall hydrolyses involved in spore germination
MNISRRLTMNTIKKLLIGLIGILLVVSGYNTPVYASELSGQENIGVSSEAAGIIYEDSVIDSEAAGMNSEDKVLNLEAFGTGTEGTVANPENIDANIENTESNSGESGKINLSGTEEASDESYPMDIEDFSDTDNYEIYVDEQGQICYIEKEPAEPVIEDDSDIPDDEQEDTGKSGNNYSESDLRLLACLVYAEAGNQSYKGMLAVANVVLNRVKSPVFAHANTIEEVIYDNKWTVQFTSYQ